MILGALVFKLVIAVAEIRDFAFRLVETYRKEADLVEWRIKRSKGIV